jgi:hypothetical protein
LHNAVDVDLMRDRSTMCDPYLLVLDNSRAIISRAAGEPTGSQ